MNGLAVTKGALALFGGKQFVCVGLINYPQHGPLIRQQADGNGGLPPVAHEIDGAVDGIHYEGGRVRQPRAFLLLAQKGGLGAQRQQLPPQKALHGHVGIGHVVKMSFFLMHGGLVRPQNHFARLPGKVGNRLQHGFPSFPTIFAFDRAEFPASF